MSNRYFFILEAVIFIISVVLGMVWINNPNSNTEPLLASVFLLLPLTEYYRRNTSKLLKLSAQNVDDKINLATISDAELFFLEKLQKLELPKDEAYLPQSDEMNVCMSLSSQGYLVKAGNKFQLTDKCLEFFKRYLK